MSALRHADGCALSPDHVGNCWIATDPLTRSIHTGMGQPEHGPVTERDAEPGPRERSVKLDGPSQGANPACALCGGPHPFDTSLPSPLWNRVIRDGGLPDYLCTTCIVLAFVKAGESFEAELYGEAVDRPDRVPIIRVQVDDRPVAS